jgi:hypothetical protein
MAGAWQREWALANDLTLSYRLLDHYGDDDETPGQ